MNGFISALAAQLASQPVSPAADGPIPRPRMPAADGPAPPVTELRNRRADRRCRAAPGRPCAPAAAPASGEAGASMLRPPQPEGGFAGEMQARLVLRRPGMAAHIRDVLPRDRRYGDVCLRCALGSSAMARCSRNAFRAPGRGDMLTLRIPERLAVAEYRRDVFPGGHPWQVFRFMHPRRGLGREKRPSLATYRRRVSKTSWLWQDMRAMYPKSAANRLSGMHGAQILPGRGPFRRTGPSNHARREDLAAIQRS